MPNAKQMGVGTEKASDKPDSQGIMGSFDHALMRYK